MFSESSKLYSKIIKIYSAEIVYAPMSMKNINVRRRRRENNKTK